MAKVLDYDGLDHVVDKIYDLVNSGGSADYIVEQGTSGIWTYRKWASGIAECWGNKTYSVVNCDGVWGSLNTGYQNPSYETYPSGLFISAPNCQISWDANNGSYNFFVASRNEAGEGTKDRTPSWQYVRPAGGNVGGTFFYHAKGFWKAFTPSAVRKDAIAQSLIYRGVIDSSDNLNNITQTGIYHIKGSVPSGLPSGSYIWCYVFVICANDYALPVITQILIRPASGAFIIREKSGNPANWSAWKSCSFSNIT